MGRRRGLRADEGGQHRRRVPAGKRGHAPHADGGEAEQVRGYRRARLALSARPDGQHPAVRQAQERRGTDRISAPQAGRYPGRDLRHLRLSGTGDAGGADPVGLFARRCRPAAPRDGQEGPGRNGRAAPAVRRWLPGTFRYSGARSQRTVRPDRQVCGLRLQQVARRRLRAAVLPDGVAESALSGGILRRVHVLRHAPVGKTGAVRRRRAAAGRHHRAARCERQPCAIHGRADRRWPRGPLCAGGHPQCGGQSDGCAGGGAGRQWSFR